MAAVDDVIGAIEKAIEALDAVDTDVATAIEETGAAIEKATEVGDPTTIEAFTDVKEELESLKGQLAAFKEGADETLGKAKAIQGDG